MGVGSIGGALRPYDESDTFLSTDAGVTWSMVLRDAHKYEFGDKGGIILAVNDEESVDFVKYSTDLGRTWYVVAENVQRESSQNSPTANAGKPYSSAYIFVHARCRPSRTRHPKSSYCLDSSRARTRRARAA